MDIIQEKLCECGCGQVTQIARQTRTDRGWVKGQPKRFVQSHQPRATEQATIERFWSKVEKTDTCWIWRSSLNDAGYGDFHAYRRTILAHRFSWQLVHGPIPVGLYVLHNCPGGDNPACVNPTHLWLGTAADNSQDMVAKGRSAKGEKQALRKHPERFTKFLHPEVILRGSECAHAKLTEDDIPAIRLLHAQGVKAQKIADQFSVGRTTISAVLCGKIWRHVA